METLPTWLQPILAILVIIPLAIAGGWLRERIYKNHPGRKKKY